MFFVCLFLNSGLHQKFNQGVDKAQIKCNKPFHRGTQPPPLPILTVTKAPV